MHGINENMPIQDIFCSGIGAIEQLEGGCLRFYLYVLQESDGSDGQEKVLVAKIVAPKAAVPDAVMKMVAAIGSAAVKIVPLVDELLH